jgi:lysylphosphatidylglycerol synthetase-like protein (DUF2156 family)
VTERVSAGTGILAVVIVCTAVVAGTTTSFTWPARLVTAAGAVLVFVVAVRAPRASRAVGDRPRRGYAAWAALALAAVAWQLAAYLQSPRREHPTLSSMLDAADAHDPLRATVYLGWILLGLVLVRR